MSRRKFYALLKTDEQIDFLIPFYTRKLITPTEFTKYLAKYPELRRREHRKLRNGKYQFKYNVNGRPHFVYSWRLESPGSLPAGKKPYPSLWELEMGKEKPAARMMFTQV